MRAFACAMDGPLALALERPACARAIPLITPPPAALLPVRDGAKDPLEPVPATLAEEFDALAEPVPCPDD